MSQQIPTAMVQQFHGDVEMLLQQKGSRLRPHVRVEDQQGESQFWEQVGPTEAVPISNRHGDSPQVDSQHDRRRVTLQFFDWGDFIDKIDRVRILIDPTNAYTQNAVYALGRRFDRIIMDAMFGTASTGKDGSVSVAFTTAQTVVKNFGGTDVGLTVPKLARAKRLLKRKNVEMDAEMISLAYAAGQLEDMLNNTQVTSVDYNSVKALVDGSVKSFMGFEFVHSELVAADSTDETLITERYLPVWAKSGLLLAISPDVQTAVERRWDKRGNVYVYAMAGAGAVRMQEGKVVKIIAKEAAII